MQLILTGDINLMGLNPSASPFAELAREFGGADFVFGNLECCLYDPPRTRAKSNPAFYAPAKMAGEILKEFGIGAVGIANNVNFGEEPITSSIKRLDELGILHTGAGYDLAAARAPAVVEAGGRKLGFLQRTSVYWAANHEARDDAAGVAVIRGHTSYELPLHRETQPMNRPGVPPIVRTWADPAYLRDFISDLAALRSTCDIVVASFHWGVGTEVLDYMQEIAHSSIDAGADVVIGHGPHHRPLPIEMYKGKPVFYGLGPLAFHTGHIGRISDWLGMFVKIEFEGSAISRSAFQFVRQDEAMRVKSCSLIAEAGELERMKKISAKFNAALNARGNAVEVTPVR